MVVGWLSGSSGWILGGARVVEKGRSRASWWAAAGQSTLCAVFVFTSVKSSMAPSAPAPGPTEKGAPELELRY